MKFIIDQYKILKICIHIYIKYSFMHLIILRINVNNFWIFNLQN